MGKNILLDFLHPITELIISDSCEFCNCLNNVVQDNYKALKFSSFKINVCKKCSFEIAKLLIPINTSEPKCRICLSNSSKRPLCDRCSSAIGTNVSVHSIFYYQSKIKTLINLLKYHFNLRISDFLSALIVEQLQTNLFEEKSFAPNIVIPAPSATDSIFNRGFDSTYRLAKLISKKTNAQLFEFRIDDPTFYLRSKREPIKRISAGIPKFTLKVTPKNRCSMNLSNILIVDDVISTGATVLGLANSIKVYNPATIQIVSVARSKFYTKLCLNLLHREGIRHAGQGIPKQLKS